MLRSARRHSSKDLCTTPSRTPSRRPSGRPSPRKTCWSQAPTGSSNSRSGILQ
ncbi:hypothetical protein FOZ63_006745, partial [Perkinsus olseni]